MIRPFSYFVAGFLAVAHKDGSVFVVDMRGPQVILRDVSDKQSQRRSFLHRHEIDEVVSMAWTVAGIDTGTSFLSPFHQLLTSTKIYSLE